MKRRVVLVPALAGLVLFHSAALGGEPRTFEAAALRVDGLVGTLVVEVVESGPMQIEVDGPSNLVEDLAIRSQNKVLIVERDKSIFDWRSQDKIKWQANFPTVTVRAPAGSPLEIDGMKGRARVGDLNGPVTLVTTALDAEFGDVADVTAYLSGAGDIAFGRIAGRLVANLNASGKLTAESAASAEINVSGSGDVSLGPIGGDFSCNIAGSGNVTAASVNGAVKVRINGSGDVRLQGGRAVPLKVWSNGSGDFTLNGDSVDPVLAANGSGTIRLEGYSGWITLHGYTGQLRWTEGGGLQIGR